MFHLVVPMSIIQNMQQYWNELMTDKLGVAVGASVLTAQGTRGVISTWKLKRLFISVWREKYNGCQIDFFNRSNVEF